MRSNIKKIKTITFFIILILLFNGFNSVKGLSKLDSKRKILVINSYNEGYKWSDDIVTGIESKFDEFNEEFEISLEFMDTKRVNDEIYLNNLYELYKNKFSKEKYDIVIACDEAAYQFILDEKDEVFYSTPVVFCGINYFDYSQIENYKDITGVVENYDIEDTLETALEIDKDVKNVYIVSDSSLTGQAVKHNLDEAKEKFASKMKFYDLSNKDLREIENQIEKLSKDSIVLYLFYFEDTKGVKYNYDEAINIISEKTKVPIYTVWDFNLGNGALGGKVTSGYYQGYTAAEIAYRIIQGESAENIKVIQSEGNFFQFDYEQMKRFNIEKSALPWDSLIINESFQDKKSILVLNSYHHGMQWTDDIEQGLTSILSKEEFFFYFDYMDTKKNSAPDYIKKESDLLKTKYENKKFDLIITTDDDAFVFVKKYGQDIFQDTPIIFCGVNYFDENSFNEMNNISGVVESIDIRDTIDLAIKQNPTLKEIFVINDSTVTGKANAKLVNDLCLEYSGKVEIRFNEESTIYELLNYIKILKKDSCILLMTYNKDKANNNFDYYSIGKLVSQAANVPVYALWDFYLGTGVVGGVMTSGLEQGQIVGNIGRKVLEGEDINSISPILDSPNKYMFDYKAIERFGINESTIPEDSIVINKDPSFYITYKRELRILLVSLILIGLVIVIAMLELSKSKFNEKKLELLASTDQMTGVYNRRKGISILEKEMKNCTNSGCYLSICFIDVDNLKITNDTLGHDEGDKLINNVCNILKESIKEKDYLVRLGGDEFLIILPCSEKIIKESLTRKIESNLIKYNEGNDRKYKISISYGFSEFNPQDEIDVDELIIKADSEMYAEKQRKKSERLG
jgi:diguanylate cyclase (GGDEF)-like protein